MLGVELTQAIERELKALITEAYNINPLQMTATREGGYCPKKRDARAAFAHIARNYCLIGGLTPTLRGIAILLDSTAANTVSRILKGPIDKEKIQPIIDWLLYESGHTGELSQIIHHHVRHTTS